ncbi:MAG: S9 family peptidase [Dinghuibacter sp.]|nr:S9 family peptidase [Dinghuibacter sp.]
MKLLLTACLALFLLPVMAQPPAKKTLTHSVYDNWKSVGERLISNNGEFAVYTINPQEGDGVLYIRSLSGAKEMKIDRGYSAAISFDSRFIVFKIKPFFKDARDARIKKKRADDMPKDTLAIVEWGRDSIIKIPRVKTFKMPEKADGWLAYHLEKGLPETPPRTVVAPDSVAQIARVQRMADSLKRVSDSLLAKISEAREKGIGILAPPRRTPPPATPAGDPVEEGTELVLRNLATGKEEKYKLVTDYYFSRNGQRLVVETSRKNNDNQSKAIVFWMQPGKSKADTIMKAFNDAKGFALDENGDQLAFVAERDSVSKALRKYYKLWYYTNGMDSASILVHKDQAGVPQGFTVSADYANQFGKNGKQLFFGFSPIRKPKDTALVDFETARLDIWHYKEDYLQSAQVTNVNTELRRSYAAVYHPAEKRFVALGKDGAENISLVDEGNAPFVLATSNKGNRVATQWTGRSKQNAYIISTLDGSTKTVAQGIEGGFSASPKGKYIGWYDSEQRHYFAWETATGIARNISLPLGAKVWDEEDDHPDFPPPYGTAGWMEDDRFLLVYDMYDIWKVDPQAILAPENTTAGVGRKNKTEYRYINLDREKRFITNGEQMILRGFNKTTKNSGYYSLTAGRNTIPAELIAGAYNYGTLIKAKNADRYLLNRSHISHSELFAVTNWASPVQFTQLSEQQKEYVWPTAELVKWKMFDGKMSEGLLFKPDNFDPAKKYPVIFYFYERNADDLHNYRAPAPSASTINIPYFVSNGYIVFDPNIYYKNGEPGQSAYNSVVSAAKYLAKMPWVDSTKMAIQGQSWGGYQVAYLVTRTNMFAAAGAGAPVANMTSAYGGIRWGAGISRQFQYEKSQSRIGGTLWQKRDLYIKNSPLFFADKVKTPLLIMHNDKDGAVPWWQGIELFSALRRLDKPSWLLQYNDEDHNLVERRNRKDLSIRLGQFFDHYLKGKPMPRWMREGVPATEKGIDWGLE